MPRSPPKKKTTFSLGPALSSLEPVTKPLEIPPAPTETEPVGEVVDYVVPKPALPKNPTTTIIQPITTAVEAFKAAGRELGFPPSLIKSLLGRVRDIEPLGTNELRITDNITIIAKSEHVIERILDHMDDYAMGKASIRDLAVAFGIMIEKRQLLKGEPTQVISIEHREELPDVIRALLIEAKRRDIPIELAQSEYTEIVPTHRASVSPRHPQGKRASPGDYDTPTVRMDRK